MIPPRICDTDSRAPRSGVNAPTRTIPSETAGLNNPPETRKKIQALTASENPKDREMYSLRLAGNPSEKRKYLQVGSVGCGSGRPILAGGGTASDGCCWDVGDTVMISDRLGNGVIGSGGKEIDK